VYGWLSVGYSWTKGGAGLEVRRLRGVWGGSEGVGAGGVGSQSTSSV